MEYVTSRITIDPLICNGKPTFRGTRIAVQSILEFLAAGDSIDEILHQYPSLDSQDIQAGLEFVKEKV